MSACTQIRHLQAIGLVAMAGLAGCSKGEEVSVPLQVAEAKLDSVSSFEPHISGFEGFLAYPFALDTDEEGNIYVLDLRERRIVVLDPAFQVLRIIGREGQGPGEFEFREQLGANAHRLSVRGGILAVDDSRQTVHIFRTDGQYLTRFRIQGDSINDIEVTPEGNILIAVLSQDNSLWEFTQAGEIVRKYGEPLVQTGLDPYTHAWVRRYLIANRCEVIILPDGRVVTMGIYWPRLRIYEDGVFQGEAEVDLRRLAEAVPQEEIGSVLEDMVETFRANPPEAINEAARAGTLTDEYPGMPGMWMLFQVEPREGHLWGHLSRFLFEIELDGTVPQVIILSSEGSYPIGAYGLAFSQNRAVFSNAHNATLAFAELPW